MAERVEDAEIEADEARVSPAASAAAALAIGLREARRRDKADPRMDAFLDEQTDLVRLQKEHLHEQRELTLSRQRWGRFSDRMKALLQVMTAVVGVAIACGIGGMAWTASQERGLVIEPFSVPPDVAQKGLTGQVLASMLLDKLGDMQTATRSSRSPSTYANNWNDQIKVEIPETGVSIGELRRLFVQWFGHQTSISGELYRTPTGLAIQARTGTASAKTHAGGDADIGILIQQAAEDVYSRTQPYRYAVYVQGETFDAAAAARSTVLLQRLAASGDRIDRIWALAALSAQFERQGSFGEALAAATRAIALEPRFPMSYFDRSDIESTLGHDEAAIADERAGLAVLRRSGREFLTVSALRQQLATNQAGLENSLGDNAAAARDLAAGLDGRQPAANDYMVLAQYQALAHDLPAARLASANVGSGDAQAGDLFPGLVRAMKGFTDSLIAWASEDWAKAPPGLQIAKDGLLGPASPIQFQTYAKTLIGPYLAVSAARAGDLDRAKAEVSAMPLDCYACTWARGDVAAVSGDARAADRWFAEAIRQAPSSPLADVEWARAKLARGDVRGAAALLATTIAKSPHAADASELWGQALMRQGDYAGAASHFAAAVVDAPAWGRARLEWAEALMLSGRYAEARRQFEAANGLELAVGERAALEVLLARTASGPLHG